MKCEEARDELIAYVKGELSPARRKAVEEHLVRCAGCTAELEGARQVMALTRMADDASIGDLAKEVLVTAITAGASDIHVEKEKGQPRIRLRIDGVLRPGPDLRPEHYEALVAHYKMLANMSLSNRRIPQDGRILFTHNNKDYDFRVSLFPWIYGEGIVMRILDRSSACIGLEKLQLSPEILAGIESLLARPTGLFVATGPTGSGKTTTLYSMLVKVNRPEAKVLTIEDPVEYQLPGVNQAQVDARNGLTFASALRSFMRSDPDAILVGDSRDLETACLCMQAALTGHLVLTSLLAPDAVSALVRLVEMGIEPFLVASAVIGVLSQRLPRIICAECREPYEASAESLRRMGLDVPPDTSSVTLYRGRGCAKCRETGYRGRASIAELLVMDETVGDLIRRGATSPEIRKATQAAGTGSLRQDGLRKALEGVTTVEEVLRVTADA